MSPEDQALLDQILDEFCRTRVTFRPVKCEAHGATLLWTVAPVIHDVPVVEDLSVYVTGDGESPKRLGSVEPQ